jgi:hypothetical protein
VKERVWVTVVERSARIGVDGDAREGGPGTLFTFEPGERHFVASHGGARILLLLHRGPARATTRRASARSSVRRR